MGYDTLYPKFGNDASTTAVVNGLLASRQHRTFSDAADSYLENGGSPRYLDKILPVLGHLPVALIAPHDIRQAAIEAFPGRKPGTLNRCGLTPARAVINHAYDRGWCSLIRMKRFKEEKPVRKGYATQLWLHLFFRQCRFDKLPHIAALVLFMAQTGARISEALRLTWRYVNMHRREALLLKTKTNTNSIRSLTDDLVTRFTELQYLHRPADDDRVFVVKCRHNVNDRIRAVCARAGIEYKPAHVCGRVTYANMAMDMGVDVKTAMAGGDWVSSPVFLDIYVRPRENASRIVADRFNQISFSGHV